MSTKKSEIELNVNGKSVNAYLVAPANGGPGILLLHAWWGLKPFFKQLCDQLAEHDYVVLAPDLRDGQVARTIDEAKELMQKSDDQLTGEIVMAAKDHLHDLTKNKIGVIGFSMGAAWALVAASSDPDKIAATVLFYGAYPGMNFSKVMQPGNLAGLQLVVAGVRCRLRQPGHQPQLQLQDRHAACSRWARGTASTWAWRPK